MGTATMNFKEGLIISGSAANRDGTESDYALVVTGSAVFDTRDGASGESGGITVIKDESDPVFMRFINDDDPVSWYAYMAMDSAENFYISPGRSQDFYIVTRENSGANYYYPIRIFDDGKIKIHQAAQSSSDSQAALPSDVVFSVSGSNDRQNSALFGGDVVISGSLYTKQRHITTNKFNISNTAQNYLRFDAAGQNQPNAGENNMFLAPANGRLISVHIRTQGAAGNTTIKLFKNTDTYEHTNDDSGNRVFETELQSVQENISAAFTTVKFTFGSAASFNEGDALGISIQGTSNPNAGNLTCIWEFDFVS